ncbi:MAG: alkaline phosphatase D family protein [Sedimentisphaerales bacterium]|nr:alkaline phosphatase D family protein [Sedimentisphaerales bacterium]
MNRKELPYSKLSQKTANKTWLLSLLCPVILFFFVPAASAQEQYKLISRDAISQIVDGEYDAAIKHFENYLIQHPKDLESMYGLAVAYSQKNDITTAMAYVEKAVDEGLQFGRFLAGPRDLLKPLNDSAEFKALAQKHNFELLHGPMLGCVTDTSAKFWVRTANEVPVQVLIGTPRTAKSPISSAIVTTAKEKDFTAVLAVRGLKPDTRYPYKLVVDGRIQPRQWAFRTFPAPGAKSTFWIGFGGGAGFTPQYERMWDTITSHNLHAFLLLGDNVYIDNPTRQAVQQYCYYRRQSRLEFRDFAASTAIFSIWDDHDFTTNDAGGGPEIMRPYWKLPVWRTFVNNWVNPYYAGGETQPGCWYDFSIGDIDFFMLDGRYYRTTSKVTNPSMLGDVQKMWLLKKLKSSKATFKVIASPVPWSYGAKPGSQDPWQGYKAEREQIFSFLESNKIDGVILISADRHRSDIWKIERPKGYDLYEFESSKLTNIHTHKIMPGSLFGYNKKCSFGRLQFDTTIPDPQVTYKIISIDNEVIYTFSLKKSQLTSSNAK